MTTNKMREELLPCPFCGSANIDPVGWMAGDGRQGPACDDCMASADSVERWNTRQPALPDGFAAVPASVVEDAISALQIADHVAESDHATAADYALFNGAEVALTEALGKAAAMQGVFVPVEVRELYEFMATAFTPMTSQQEQIAIALGKAKAAMRASKENGNG